VGARNRLPRDGIREAIGLARQRNQIRREFSRFRHAETLTRAALVDQHRLGHRPAVVDLPDDVGVGDHDVIECLLAEAGVSVNEDDRPDRYTLCRGRDPEPR
jgi:hypothetical protein